MTLANLVIQVGGVEREELGEDLRRSNVTEPLQRISSVLSSFCLCFSHAILVHDSGSGLSVRIYDLTLSRVLFYSEPAFLPRFLIGLRAQAGGTKLLRSVRP